MYARVYANVANLSYTGVSDLDFFHAKNSLRV